MGYLSRGKKLGLHRGEIVSHNLLFTSERGNSLAQGKRCHYCWFFGERLIISLRRNGEAARDMYLLSRGTVVYFTRSDMEVPEGLENGMVCLAGLRDFQTASQLITLEEPGLNSCWQQRTCEP